MEYFLLQGNFWPSIKCYIFLRKSFVVCDEILCNVQFLNEYSALDISLLEIFSKVLQWNIFYSTETSSNGCNISHTVGHVWNVISFGFLEWNILRWTFLYWNILDIALHEIFCDGIFSFPRELLAFQWLQYPPYRWTFLQCKAFPLSPRLLSQQTTPTINKQLQPKIN